MLWKKGTRKRECTAEYKVWIAGLLFGLFGMTVLLLHYFTPFSLYSLSYPCSFYEKTGVYCPGCGGTRAVFALLKGNIIRSIYYHPVVFYVTVLYGAFMFRGCIAVCSKNKYAFMKLRAGYLYAVAAIVLVQWIVKLTAVYCFHFRYLG